MNGDLTPKAAAGTVAMVFADLEGSTKLVSSLGPKLFGDLLDGYGEVLAKAASAHRGEIAGQEGDGLFLMFPTAAGAVEAMVVAQRELAERTWPGDAEVRARMGIHAGEAHRSADQWVGLEIHRAARIAGVAWGGQVVVSDAVRSLALDALGKDQVELRDLGEHELKDLPRPERLHQVVAPRLGDGFPPLRSLTTVPNNLPHQPTSFVGRQREQSEVAGLVREHRLVTLTGVGGTGKTRLAIEVATEMVAEMADGVWLVELAPITDPNAVIHEVARVLGLRHEQDEERPAAAIDRALVDHLANRNLLVVLDNCEHVLDPTARLCDLLIRACEGVTILTTSREGLGVAGEALWQVPSLATPQGTDRAGERSEAAETDELSDAEQLFAERARAASARFNVDEKTRPAVAEICRRLDGLPLAIELAAARVRVLPVDQLAARLGESFRLLTGGARTALPRQQTLQAAIDWSHDMLTAAEQALFARLSVFAGGFTLAAAEAVCSSDGIDDAEVLPLLSDLVDKSLVLLDHDTDGRYRLLEPLRQYARDQLVAAGASETFRRRHRDWFLERVGMPEEQVYGEDRALSDEELAADHDNFQAAYQWSLARGDTEEAAVLADPLLDYWHATGQHRLAADIATDVLTQSDLTHRPRFEAALRASLAVFSAALGRDDTALEEASRAHELVAGDDACPAKLWVLQVYATRLASDVRLAHDQAIAPAQEALEIARALGNAHAEFRARQTLIGPLLDTGQQEEARRNVDALHAVARRLDSPALRMGALHQQLTLAFVADKDHDRLRTTIDEVFDLVEQHPPVRSRTPWGWITETFGALGQFDDMNDTIERRRSTHLEGHAVSWLLFDQATLLFMRGRLDEAAAEIDKARREGLSTRSCHDVLPLEAEIAAFQRHLDRVHTVAGEYVGMELGPEEQIQKVGVLRPVIHAEVDAALASPGLERDDHLRSARDALETMRKLHELQIGPTLQYESPRSYLHLAEAELTRATGPDPDAWRRAQDHAFMAYWRLYAHYRRGEALLAAGDRDEAAAELAAALATATEMGAELIQHNLEALARDAGAAAGAGGEVD